MAYLELGWGGDDSGTTNSAGTISSTGRYPAGRAAYNSSTGATTYPILVTEVGANVAAVGTTARNGTITVGAATSVSKELPEDSDGANIARVWVQVTPDKLINVSSSVQDTTFKWTGNTYSVYAGRDSSSSYTTVYNGSSRTGRMGGGIRYYLVPAAPGKVTATSSTTSYNTITLSWTAPSDDGGTAVTGYNVFRSTSTSSLGTLIGTSTTTTYTDNDASKSIGTKYYYHVTAKNAVTTAAGSTISGVESADPLSGDGAYAPGVPYAPTVSASPSTTNNSTVVVTYSASVPEGSPAILYYDIYRNGTIIGVNQTSTTFSDNGSAPNSQNYYQVIAKNAIGSSAISDYPETPVLVPSIPTAPVIFEATRTGRSITVYTSTNSYGFGLSILGYYIQYQSIPATGGSWSAWSTPVQTSGAYVFENLNPAMMYRFRAYAANSIINNYLGVRSYYPHNDLSYTATFSNNSSNVFVPAGGKRLRGTNESNPATFQPTNIVKRHVGTGWVDVSTAKRYDATLGWVDLE